MKSEDFYWKRGIHQSVLQYIKGYAVSTLTNMLRSGAEVSTPVPLKMMSYLSWTSFILKFEPIILSNKGSPIIPKLISDFVVNYDPNDFVLSKYFLLSIPAQKSEAFSGKVHILTLKMVT